MSFFQKGKVIKRKVSFRTCQIVQITCTMHTLCPFLKRGAAFKKGKKCVCVCGFACNLAHVRKS